MVINRLHFKRLLKPLNRFLFKRAAPKNYYQFLKLSLTKNNLITFYLSEPSKKLLPEKTNILKNRQYVFQEIILKIFAVVMLKARKFSKVSRTTD
jgi:hypothetical protein